MASLSSELGERLAARQSSKTRGAKGLRDSGKSMEEILTGLRLAPDFRTVHNLPSPLRYIHRTYPGGEVYFVANPASNQVSVRANSGRRKCRLSSGCRRQGNARACSVALNGDCTALEISLGAFESLFVVFKPVTEPQDPVVRFAFNGRPLPRRNLSASRIGTVVCPAETAGRTRRSLPLGTRLAAGVAHAAKGLCGWPAAWVTEFGPDGRIRCKRA